MNATPNTYAMLGSRAIDGTLTGVTTGTGATIPPQNSDRAAVVVIGTGTISGGTILIEEADFATGQSSYSGTYSLISTITASGVSGGAQQIVHIAPNCLTNIRARISSNITGGGSVVVLLKLQ